jgi:hypothetical protein
MTTPRALLIGAACLLAGAAFAETTPWQGRLTDGSRLQVDPTTRRATVIGPEGIPRQPWDGVHRLEDGSTVTIHSGVAVPTRQMAEAPPARAVVTDRPSACLVLVRKTCGLHDECRDHEACGHANQLIQFERDEEAELKGSTLGSTYLEATHNCEQALQDEAFFKPCDRSQRGPVPTPCERLVDRVCGAGGACVQGAACGPARQLLETEYQERAASPHPDALTATSGECGQALRDKEFFVPCKP